MPANRQLIQVVPRLAPAHCGLSDAALLLAAELKAAFDIDSAMAVVNAEEQCSVDWPTARCAPEQLIDACLSLSAGLPAHLLVHLSGYGYSADGAPCALAGALERAKADGRFRIAVFFHELHASGRPWTSAFWHRRRQKRAYRRIVEVCDLPVTNAEVFRNWLERQVAAPVRCLPVFSHVGEMQEPGPFSGREPVMAVFGLGETRQRVYEEIERLGDSIEGLGIREILDIGPAIETPRQVRGIAVKRAGVLSASEIDRLFATIAFGYLAYPPNCLAKSGVFAAYAAHGVIPLVARDFREEFDGLRDGVHLLSLRTARAIAPDKLEDCSRAAWSWYSEHRLRDHAAMYDRWIHAAEPA